MSRYHLRRINIPPNRGSSNPDVIVLLDKDSVKFGRNPDQVDIVLNSALYNNMISREHAEIVRRRNADGSTAYYLLDKSLNGTYVKSIRAHGPVLLHAGDIIHFGHINGAAINPGEAAPQPDAEFTYVFEKSQRVSPVQPGIQAAQMFPTNAPGGQNLYAPYQHQAGGAQFNPYSFGGGGHPAIMSHLGLAAAYGNLGSMLPPNMSAAYAAAQLGAAHQQVLSSAHHPAGPETVGLNMPGGHNWMSYGGAQNQPRGVPQQQKPMASGFRYPQAVVSQPSDFVMGGGGQSAFRHAYFNRDGSEMSDPANTLANLHHQQVLMNNSANQQQLGLSRNPVVTTQQQQQSVVNRSQIGSQPELKAHVGSGGLPPQQQFLNRPYGGGDPNVSPFDRQNLGNFPGIPQNTSLPPTEMRPCMSDNTTKPEGMASVIMPNLSVAGRDVKSEYFQPSCSIPNDSINHMSPLSALAEVAKRQTDSQPIVSRPRSVAEVPTKIEQNSTAKLDLKDVTTPQQPLKMECDSSVPSPPTTRLGVHTTEVVESADINQELLSLARKCVTSHSPAEEMFDLDTEINQKADLSKSPVTTRLPDDSGNDSSGRSSRPKQKLNEVARLLNDISSSSFMFNVRKKCGEISSSSGSSSDDDNDKDSDADDKSEGEKKSKKGKDKGDSQKSSTPTSIKSPGSQKGRVKSPAKKSQSPDAKKDKVETKVAQKPTQSDSSASESSSEEDKSDEDESDSSVDRRKKTAKKPVVKKGTTVTRATPKSSDTPQSASGAKGQRKRAEPPSSHLSTGPKGAEGRKGKGSSRADLSSDEEEDQISSNSDSDYDKPIAKKQRKSASSKRNSSPVTKKSKSKATGTTSAKRSRKTSATKPTKQRKRKQKNSSDDDDVDADSDEPALTSLHNPDVPCAAQKKCRKPQSANVEWIACDDCDKWFHVECADCDPEAAKQERFQFHCGCDE